MPPQQGIALRELSAGQSARILHVEDEPPAVYAQLVAQGVYPGVFVHVLGKEIDRLRLEIGGNEQMLAPILADNINVLPIEKTVVQEGTILTLAELRPGHDAIVSEISKGCRGPQRRRLLDLGIVPGTVIKSEVESMAGDPTAYRVRGATIALRKQQARMIYVRKGDE
jgi:DtxR family Mn-dependent transcriptional regulator